MASKSPRPPYTPQAAQRLADLYVRRFKTQDNDWASVGRAPGKWDSAAWDAYYEDAEEGRSRGNPTSRAARTFNEDVLYLEDEPTSKDWW